MPHTPSQPPLQLAIKAFHRARRMTAGAAREGGIPERYDRSRIFPDHAPTDLVVCLRLVDVGFPAQPSPSDRAVELQEGVFMGEDVLEVDLKVGDRGAARARDSYVNFVRNKE
jgi:hypothetical protein